MKKYIKILEALYIVFRVTPYSKKIARSLLKEPKIYFYDNGLVESGDGAILENVVAFSLLKSIYGRNDYLGEKEKLHYLNTKEGKEVDFAIISDDKIIKDIIEVKVSDSDLSKSLKYFSLGYNLKASQVVKNLKREKKISDNIAIVKAESFLKDLYL